MPYIFRVKKVQRVQLAHLVFLLGHSLIEAFKIKSLLSNEGDSSFDGKKAFVNHQAWVRVRKLSASFTPSMLVVVALLIIQWGAWKCEQGELK